MKITFFLIAFCLVFVRLYMGWTGHWRSNGNDGVMSYSNGDDDIELKWSGKATLNDSETAVASITPGGYLKFRHNGEKMVAESNLQGDITYELYDGPNQLTLDETGKKFLAGIINEMIEFGYHAEERMERIYKKGGKNALLNEEEKLRSDNLKGMYIDRLLKTDSLTKEDLETIATRVGELGQDFEKGQRLARFTPVQLKDSDIVQTWLASADRIGNDHDKGELLGHLIAQQDISDKVMGEIFEITGHFSSDWEKENLLSKLIEKDSIPPSLIDNLFGVIGQLGDDHGKGDLLSKLIDRNAIPTDHFSGLLELITHFGNDFEKELLYKKLVAGKNLTETEWSGLIGETGKLGADFDKADLLVKIAANMPASDELKTAYRNAAKTINDDQNYGKAIRAIE